MDRIAKWISELVLLVLLLALLGLVASVVFGTGIPFLAGIQDNIMKVLGVLAKNQVIGLIALAILAGIYNTCAAGSSGGSAQAASGPPPGGPPTG